MARELEALSGVLENPRRPLVAIIGGAKISTKIAVVENLLAKVDTLWIGGAMRAPSTGPSARRLGNPWWRRSGSRPPPSSSRPRGGEGQDQAPIDVVVTSEPVAGSPTTVVAWTAIPPTRWW